MALWVIYPESMVGSDEEWFKLLLYTHELEGQVCIVDSSGGNFRKSNKKTLGLILGNPTKFQIITRDGGQTFEKIKRKITPPDGEYYVIHAEAFNLTGPEIHMYPQEPASIPSVKFFIDKYVEAGVTLDGDYALLLESLKQPPIAAAPSSLTVEPLTAAQPPRTGVATPILFAMKATAEVANAKGVVAIGAEKKVIPSDVVGAPLATTGISGVLLPAALPGSVATSNLFTSPAAVRPSEKVAPDPLLLHELASPPSTREGGDVVYSPAELPVFKTGLTLKELLAKRLKCFNDALTALRDSKKTLYIPPSCKKGMSVAKVNEESSDAVDETASVLPGLDSFVSIIKFLTEQEKSSNTDLVRSAKSFRQVIEKWSKQTNASTYESDIAFYVNNVVAIPSCCDSTAMVSGELDKMKQLFNLSPTGELVNQRTDQCIHPLVIALVAAAVVFCLVYFGLPYAVGLAAAKSAVVVKSGASVATTAVDSGCGELAYAGLAAAGAAILGFFGARCAKKTSAISELGSQLLDAGDRYASITQRPGS